ncbi:adenosylcobinamide-GDP ribazoletransferase [Geomonas nitrogeniifigens]|uniref:Adenosylcobinamide-GDP ribazoletransferase n=1 Tax=Geomonas diazotrophica TaxID=2843197 RepID=A0ABX8JIL2_9BACT|nr:adenosylcobinamide-GDP ribazoletransferase [Geomonas nitrogeniifigens]QWV97102.1 adenosylcobinamide-GDP ribazoletransferase [Geomonas nitrogeniifigens]QXE86274.1 adenosylcobinamide-GDP ribazoletransferase [Geomonas nitrogeniifigens]
MRLFIIAFQFLTIVPLPVSVRCEEKDLGRSMALFPLVGLAIGALLAGTDFLLAPLLPRSVADLVLVTLLSVVTGALHLDGLSDVCDGLAARGSRERFLEIMKDSRVGAVGAVGLVLGLLLKYQALLALPDAYKREALLFFPMAARFAQVQMTVGSQRARKDGLGHAFVGGAGTLQLVLAGACTVAVAGVLLHLAGLVALLLLFFLTLGIKGWAHRRLGGVTGDVIGFASEMNEIFCLLFLLALLRRMG